MLFADEVKVAPITEVWLRTGLSNDYLINTTSIHDMNEAFNHCQT